MTSRDNGLTPGVVTTIIPVYNRSGLLREAVKSVVAQTYPLKEIIVVDDGSTDDTPAVIGELSRRYPDIVRHVRIENGGPGVAREAGRVLARGEYLQYLDSDDLLYPGKFEIQVVQLQKSQDASIAYGKTCHIGVGAPLPDDPVPFKRTAERFEYLFPSLAMDVDTD